MNCNKCNHENPVDAVFCGKCGNSMAAKPTPSPTPSPTPQPPPGPAVPVSNELKYGILIGSVLIPILGIIMGIMYIKDPNPMKKPIGKLWLYSGIGITVFYCILAMDSSNY